MVFHLALFCLATYLATSQKIGWFFHNHLVTLQKRDVVHVMFYIGKMKWLAGFKPKSRDPQSNALPTWFICWLYHGGDATATATVTTDLWKIWCHPWSERKIVKPFAKKKKEEKMVKNVEKKPWHHIPPNVNPPNDNSPIDDSPKL
jgi:hypothetical protein